MDDLKEKLERIAELTRDEVGSEENVKQKIVVPFLECFGHHRNQLDFEYGTGGKRIDIFVKDLPIDCKVIIDTKNYDEDLSNHLEQIGLYAFQEGAILALIVNGEEIRIYDPFFRGFSFKDSLLYSLKRIELTNDLTLGNLYNLLSRESLKTRKVKDFIVKREQEIMETYSKIEEIENKNEKKKMELSDKKEELIKKLDEIQGDIRSITEQITKMDSGKNDEVNEVLKSIGLPYIRTTRQQILPSDIQKLRARNIYSKSTIEIPVNAKSYQRYKVIWFPKKVRNIFPGYKIPFVIETDVGEIPSKVTAAPKGTKEGDPDAGSYIKSVSRGDLTRWYHKHKDLKLGDKLLIEVIEPKKRYRLSISE
ncbi:MAG: hypothetical protein WCO26_04875 [Deltaproteobacteria bacterium]